MDFDNNKPIYIQIYDSIRDRILAGDFAPDERIPSVREYGAMVGVNPNTVMRTYEKLTADGVIYTKRGMGYYVSPNAKEVIMENDRKSFMENEIPTIVNRMKLLGIDPSVFNDYFEK